MHDLKLQNMANLTTPSLPDGFILNDAQNERGAPLRLVVSLQDMRDGCKHCGVRGMLGGWDRRVREFADIPFRDRPVVLEVHHRRVVCKSCNCKPYVETIPGVHARRSMTQRLVSWIVDNTQRMTFKTMAELSGVDERTLRDVFAEWVRAQRATALHRPLRVSVGVVSLRGTPRIYGADLAHGAVFAMTGSVHEFFEVVGDWPLDKADYVLVDTDPRVREGLLNSWPTLSLAADPSAVREEVVHFWDSQIIDNLKADTSCTQADLEELRAMLAQSRTEVIPPMIVRANEIASARWEARRIMLVAMAEKPGALFENALGDDVDRCHPAIRFEWRVISSRISGLGDAMTRYRTGHRADDRVPQFEALSSVMSRRSGISAVISQALCDTDRIVMDVSSGERIGFDPEQLARRLMAQAST